MTTYQMTAPAPTRSGGMDVASWALVAVVVALICAGAGWAIATESGPTNDDLAVSADLAGRDGRVRGEAAGYRSGAVAGRREANLRGRAEIAAARREGAQMGREEGYQAGRAHAGDPDAYMTGGLGPSGAYPAQGYEDILRSGLFDGGDEPFYSSSAYGAYGYGTDATSPYAGSASTTDTYRY